MRVSMLYRRASALTSLTKSLGCRIGSLTWTSARQYREAPDKEVPVVEQT
jgi:hypothetical protein